MSNTQKLVVFFCIPTGNNFKMKFKIWFTIASKIKYLRINLMGKDVQNCTEEYKTTPREIIE